MTTKVSLGVVAANAVDTAQLASAAVETASIAGNAVVSAKIAANQIITAKIASNAITSGHITSGEVTTDHLADNAITTDKIAANAITLAKITSGTLTADSLADNSITGAKIAQNSIDSSEIVSGSIDTVHIADSQVTNAKLANSSVTVNSNSVALGASITLDTDDIGEGATNQYFTNARAQGAITVTDAGGDGSLGYSGGTITYTGPSAAETRAHFSAGTGIGISSGQISIGQAVATTDSPTFNDLTLDGDLNLTGDLNITGDLNTLTVTDLDVVDKTITLGAGQVESASDGSGIIVDGSSASILWDETNDEWDFNKDINVTGTVTAYGLTVETTTPVIDVLANANEDASLRLRENGTGVVGAEFTYDGGDNQLYLKVGNNTDTKRLSVSRDTGDISFYEDTGTTAKLFWDASAESLSIGTTGSTTDRRFQVSANGTSTATTQFGIVANPTYPTNVTANVYNLYSGPNLTAGTTLTNLYNIYLGANGYPSSTVTNSFGLYQAGTNDKNYFGGNVGIGTDNPLSLLHLSATSPTLIINSASTNDSKIMFRESSDYAVSIFYEGSAGSGTANNLHIRSELSGSEANLVTFGLDGDVGIGTSNPNVSGYDSNATTLTLSGPNRGLLEIRGATGVSSTQLGAIRFLAGSTSEADIICDLDGSGNGLLTFDTNGTEAMRINSSQNIGIGGNTDPSAKLHIGSASSMGNQTNPALQIGGAGNYRLGIYTTAEGAVYDNKNGDDGHIFYVKTLGEAMRIEGVTGNVGIGMTPTHQLSVIGTGTASAINLGTVGASFPDTLGMFVSSTAHTQTGYGDLNIKARTDYGGFYGIGFFTASSDSTPELRLKIDSSGNVGINETAPVSPLHKL